MNIQKFDKSDFGNLTTITNDKTGVTMFIGKEVAANWGHKNLTQAIGRICNKGDYTKVNLKKYPKFKNLLLTNKMLSSSNASTIMLLTEPALYKLALASNLEKAKPFRDWVASEVLPSIRKSGYYTFADQSNAIMIHTHKSIQLNNSKDVNSKNLIERGLDGMIEYNRESCLLHTGKTPSELKKIGKDIGLKSKQITSAKEVLRNTRPELACAMSFTDSMVKQGFDLKTVSELSLKAAVPLFQGMIELGFNPAELR